MVRRPNHAMRYRIAVLPHDTLSSITTVHITNGSTLLRNVLVSWFTFRGFSCALFLSIVFLISVYYGRVPLVRFLHSIFSLWLPGISSYLVIFRPCYIIFFHAHWYWDKGIAVLRWAVQYGILVYGSCVHRDVEVLRWTVCFLKNCSELAIFSFPLYSINVRDWFAKTCRNRLNARDLCNELPRYTLHLSWAALSVLCIITLTIDRPCSIHNLASLTEMSLLSRSVVPILLPNLLKNVNKLPTNKVWPSVEKRALRIPPGVRAR